MVKFKAHYNDKALKRIAQLQARGYELDEYGIIRSPGRFEGQHFAIIALYELWHAADDSDGDDEGCAEFALNGSELADYGLEAYAVPDRDGLTVVVGILPSRRVLMSITPAQSEDDAVDSGWVDPGIVL